MAFGLFGRPGVIDVPSANAAPEGTLAFSYTYAESFTRNAIFFQYAPWGSVTLRYSGNGAVGANNVRPNYDRSLDFSLNLLSETDQTPSLTVGLQDVIGTGAFAGEYLAVGKTFFEDKLRFDMGLGWGRFASSNAFTNPLALLAGAFEERPSRVVGRGGRPYPQEWFRGNVAVFGGMTFKATDRLAFKAEYSPDNYTKFRPTGTLVSKSPLNFGAQYAFSPSVLGHVGFLQGTEVTFGVTIHTNVKKSATVSSPVAGPPFVFTGESGWTPEEYQTRERVRDKLEEIFDKQGMRVVAFDVQGSRAKVAFENADFDAPAQAFGRMARWLTFVIEPSVDTFELTAVKSGMPVATVTIPRAALVSAEHELFGPEALQAASKLETASEPLRELNEVKAAHEFSWGISPYLQVTLFDPDDPRRADMGVQLDTSYTNGLGFHAVSSLQKRLTGNRGDGRLSNSVLPHVRTDQVLYDRSDQVKIKDFYVVQYSKLAPDVYGRVTLGYLEQMYAGISAETLWAPFVSPWSFSAEANYVRQRDYDGGFGLRDYGVVTGHLAGQYTFDSGAYAKLSVGRYLAGDKGATITVGRTFKNGWDLSAYATLTDVPFDDFGEGSFDKGIRLEIPIAALFGVQSRSKSRIELRSITRDGGARLNVPGRLSEMVEGYSRRDIVNSWSRVLR